MTAISRLSKMFPEYDFSKFEYHGSQNTKKSMYVDSDGQEAWASYKDLQNIHRKKLAAENPPPKPKKIVTRFSIHTTPEKKS